MPGVGSHRHHPAWSALVALVVMMLLVNGSMASALPAEDPAPSPSASEVTTTVEVGEGEDGPEAGASEEPSEPSGEPSEPAGQSGVATAEPGEPTEEPATQLGEATEEPGTEPGEPTDEPGAVSEEGARSLAPQEDVVGADSADGPIEPAPAAADAITPLAAGDATIRVRKAGVRSGNASTQGASGLQGAVFEAYADGNSQTQQYDPTKLEATCTTDAAGICDLKVDSAKGPRYVVVEKSAPAGWRKIDQIALGAYNASGTPRDYWWNVGVRAGQTTLVPQTEIRNVSGQDSWSNRPSSPSDPTYQWADAKDNVPLPPAKCGLSIAMLFDQSGSIGSNLPQVKSAAKQFVDDLTGTPTSIALFTFSTNSPQNNGGSQNRPALVSIADASGANQVKGYIDGFSNADGGTNWDAGLRRVANASQQYDVLIVLTDGNPTAWEGEKSSTGDVDDYDVENAIHSANWVKAKGTRIVAVGFSGQSGGLNSLNLTTISGTVQDDDYYLTTFGDLDDVLSSIALNGCGGTISVQKRIAPSYDFISSVPLEPGWGFARDAGQTYVSPPSGLTGPAGEPVTFKVTFDQGQLSRPVTITENPGSYQLVQDVTKNARCLVNNSPINPNRIVNVANGFTVTGVTDKEIISCLVVNSPAQLRAKKYNDLNGNSQQDAGEPGLQGWTLFLDKNSNSLLDAGDQSLVTDPNGLAIFDRLEAPADYRICEVQKSGWFNTDPGGGTLCKPARTAIGASVGPDVNGLGTGTLLFGNIERGAFTITKDVVDESGFVPPGTTYTVEVRCTQGGTPVPGFNPFTVAVSAGQTATVGPLAFGTTCTIAEVPAPTGADVTVEPSSVTIGQGGDVAVKVTNTYPVGYGEVVKVVDGPLAGQLAPPGTKFEVEVRCTFPADYPVQGPIPGYDPELITVVSGPTVGQPGPATQFGPLPVGSTCTATETDDNGADPSSVAPGSVTIVEGGPTESVQFTATNTFNPAALRINKVVTGPGAGLVPPDTVYTADVLCTFQGQTRFDDEVEFGVNDPGIVTGMPLALPVGTSCTVTESDSQGATWAPTTQTVELVGPQPVLVDVTITNTYAAGELTVTKAVDDGGTGLVPDGTVYTIEAACTFAGNPLPGYPQDVVLTTPDDLTKTLIGLPYGTECTLSEPNLNGAGNVAFDPSGPVTIDGTNQAVEVTATNTYPVGTFPVRKVVDGPGASFVPPGTQYTVEVRCTFPAGFPATGPVPGYNPKTVTVTGGQTVPVGPVPVGTTCGITEPGTAGAGSSTVAPESVAVAEGANTVEVVVTNTYPVGSFTVAKLASGPGAIYVPPLTPFDLEITCTYPDDHPAAPGTVDGFDGLVVTIRTGIKKGVPGLPVPVGPLPVGAECAVEEADLNGASSVEITPNPVTVPDGQGAEVSVVVENTFPAGFGEIVKVAAGPLAGQLAPEGTVFLVEVRCTLPPDFPGQDPAGPNPDTIPGYSPLELAVESGPPGQPGIPTRFGPLPVGSTCSVIETDAGGADPVDISPPGGSVGSITILDPAQDPDPVQVTVTNTFNPAALRINKVVTGPGAPLLPADAVFVAGVVCTFQGQTTFDDEVEFGVNDPGVVTDQPIGAECTVSETQSNGATNIDISPNPVLLVGPSPVLVDVTITNTMPAGSLVVEKVVAGGAAEVVPDGVEFVVGVDCTFQDSPLTDYPRELTFTTPDALSETLTGLPVGAECVVSESDDGGATSVEFTPPGDVGGQSGTVTITGDVQDPVSVTVTNIFEPALLRILKDVEPDAVLLPPGLRFIAQVDCTFGGANIYSGEVEFGVGSPGVVSGLVVGAECTITESESFGASFDPESETVTITEDQPDYEVTIVNTFTLGSLTVEKALDGDGASFVAQDTTYDIDVSCTFQGLALPGYPTTVTVTPNGGLVDLPGPLAVGTTCDFSEPDLNGASGVTFTPSDTVEITTETPDSEVVATNTYPGGDFTITKVVDGPGASAVPPNTQFTVEVSCTFPADFPEQGAIPGYSPKVVTLTPGQTVTVGPVPTGSQCGIKETGTGGAQRVSVSPDTVTVGDGTSVGVRVTNTFPAPPNPPTVAGETCDPNKPGAQLPGSITIPPNPDFAYAINGVPYAAGTYPFPAGTYQVTAQRIQAPPAGRIAQLALESFSWTVTVPGSDVCAVLDKSADPPSGETIFTGDLVAYTIAVKNGGDEAVVNETLVDQLPEGTRLDESTIDPAGGVYDDAEGTITWKFSLAAGASATFSYTVEVVTDEGTINNSVSWVERNLTGRTEHPVEPGITENITEKPPTEKPPTEKPPAAGLTDTGADVAGVGAAGLLAMIIGGLMVAFGRRRRQEG